jgi:hypothetical protein
MQAYRKETGEPVIPGEEITDFRGDKATFVAVAQEATPGSSGRVRVNQGGAHDREYYPGVYDLEIR